MKKMKGLVAMESPSYAVYEDPRTRFRHQNLLQDYDELQRETETMKRKLIIMKQKKLVLSAEVRFLRRRYKQLTTDQSLQSKPKPEMIQSQRYDARPPTIPKNRNFNRKESSAQQPPAVASDMNRKEKSYYLVEGKLPKANQVFDLNQNAKNFNGTDASTQSPVSALDLNQKEMMFSGKEANKRSMAPFFDLNEISIEEEECQAGLESVNMEEPKRSIQRSASEEQHNDMKMSVCRSAGSGPSRPGKRKISWQDQVALRV